MTEEAVIAARVYVYTYDAPTGNWKSMAGEPVSRLTIYEDKTNKTARVVSQTEGPGDVIINCYIGSDITYDSEPSQPKFHRIFDGEAYYGLNFVNDDYDKFLKAMHGLLKTHGHSAPKKTKKAPSKKSLSSSAPIEKSAAVKSPASKDGSGSSPVASPKPKSNSSSSKESSIAAATKQRSSTSAPLPNQQVQSAPTSPPPNNAPPGDRRSTVSVASPVKNPGPPAPAKAPPASPAKDPQTPAKDGVTSAASAPRLSAMLSPTGKPGSNSAPNTPTPRDTPPPIPKAPSSGANSKILAGLPASMNHAVTSPKQSPEEKLESRQSVLDLKEKKPKREMIIDEVLKTEADYVTALTVLREIYYLPLKYAPRLGLQIFAPGDFEKCFYGFETIYFINQKFLQQLEMAQAGQALYTTIGEIFNKFGASFKLYIDFVNKYDLLVKTIKQYSDSSPTFNAFLKAGQEDPECKGGDLHSYIIRPIQRIPRYVLLLREIQKNTDDSHSDYNNIISALDLVEKIASEINSKKKIYESQEAVAMIQARMLAKTLPLLREGRNFVQEALVYIKNPHFEAPSKQLKKKKDKDPEPEKLGLQPCYLFLFNDLVMWAVEEPKSGLLEELGRLLLYDIVLVEPYLSYYVPFYLETAAYKGLWFRNVEMRDDQAPKFWSPAPNVADKLIADMKGLVSAAAQKKIEELDRKSKPLLNPIL